MDLPPQGRPEQVADRVARPAGLLAAMLIAFAAALGITVLLGEPVANDANAWLAWAGQLSDGAFPAFQTGPSWKPLPVLITVAPALFSTSAAAFMWMLAVRFCALATSVLLYCLTERRWGRFAGVIAATMPLLIPDWATATITGLSEPVMVAAALAALEAELRGRTRPALLLAVIACLIRPEAWVFLAAYAAWLLGREGAKEAPALAAAAAAVLVGWGLPALGSHGDPLQSASRAHDYRSENGGGFDVGVWLRAVPAKLWPLIPVGVLAAIRRPDRVVIVVTISAGAWLVEVAALVLAGYPNFSRFALPAFVVLGLGAGAGAGWLSSLARERWQAVLVQVLISLIAIWGLAGAFEGARKSWKQAGRILDNADRAQATLKAAGGAAWVERCGPIETNGHPKYDRILSRRLRLSLESFSDLPSPATLHGSGILTGPPSGLLQGGQVVSARGGWTLTTVPRAWCGGDRR